MTKNEVLKELESLFIITKIGRDYYITDKYKTFEERLQFVEDKHKQMSSNTDAITSIAEVSDWSYEIINSYGRSRVVALMDVCQVPNISRIKKYRLRSITKELIKEVDNLIKNEDVIPVFFVEGIKQYYKTQEMPKSFKNLVIEGDAVDICQEYKERRSKGDSFIDPLEKPNSTWG